MSDEKKQGAPEKPTEKELVIPLGKFSARFRQILESTPQSKWSKIKASFATHEETIKLQNLLPVMEHVLEVVPGKLVKLLQQGKIAPETIKDAFRAVREWVNAGPDVCQRVADLVGLEVRITKEDPEPAEIPDLAISPPETKAESPPKGVPRPIVAASGK